MTIAVAVSGGVDSLVALHLLKASGHNIFAIQFLTGYEKKETIDHQTIMHSHLKQIGIDFQIIDISKAFKTHVVDYFISTYAANQTPNPCVICNAKIKFGILADRAFQLGADLIATGHYAQVEKQSDRYFLKKGTDLQKDQSYFLSMLSSYQLSKVIFPLGKWLKKDVLKYAENNNLSSMVQSESQEVCFIKQRYQDFLVQSGQINNIPGPIKTTDGNKIGTHKGLHEFTIGQRKGINCPGPYPYYVVCIEQETNTLIVGKKSDLFSNSCHIDQINWIQPPSKQSIQVEVRIRYRTPAVPANLQIVAEDKAILAFHSAQSAVTPGQIAVFYQENKVLGAGMIN